MLDSISPDRRLPQATLSTRRDPPAFWELEKLVAAGLTLDCALRVLIARRANLETRSAGALHGLRQAATAH